MNNKARLRHAIRQAAKEVIRAVLPQKFPSSPSDVEPIFLHGSRRSGSTLLMEVLASNSGVTFHDQPLSVFESPSDIIKRTPFGSYGQLVDLDNWEQLKVREAVSRLLTGEDIVNGPWRFWTGNYFARVEKVVFKITDAKCLVNWLRDQFGGKSLVLTRHPIPQADSVMRNDWMPTGRGFVRSPAYRDEFLTPDEFELFDGIYKGDDMWQQRIADWILENRPLLGQLDREDVIFVPYELLTVDPEATCKFLAGELGLREPDSMIKTATIPSRSTKNLSAEGTGVLIGRQNRDDLIGRWQKQVDQDRIKVAGDLLERCGVRLYSAANAMPACQGLRCRMPEVEL